MDELRKLFDYDLVKYSFSHLENLEDRFNRLEDRINKNEFDLIVFANPRTQQLYKNLNTNNIPLKCFGNKQLLPDTDTVSGKKVLLIDLFVSKLYTLFRKYCMLYQMGACEITVFVTISSSIELNLSKVWQKKHFYLFHDFGTFQNEEEYDIVRKKFNKQLIIGDDPLADRFCALDMYLNPPLSDTKIKAKIMQDCFWLLRKSMRDKEHLCIISVEQVASVLKENHSYSEELLKQVIDFLVDLNLIEYLDDTKYFVAECVYNFHYPMTKGEKLWRIGAWVALLYNEPRFISYWTESKDFFDEYLRMFADSVDQECINEILRLNSWYVDKFGDSNQNEVHATKYFIESSNPQSEFYNPENAFFSEINDKNGFFFSMFKKAIGIVTSFPKIRKIRKQEKEGILTHEEATKEIESSIAKIEAKSVDILPTNV